MRNTAASCFPSTRVVLRFSRSGSCTSGKTRGGQDGGRNLGYSRLPFLPSRERATRNNAAATAQDARDRAERFVHAAIDRTRRSAISAAEAKAKAQTKQTEHEIAVEARDTVLAARHRLAVDDAGAGAQLVQRLHNQREAVGQVVARSAVELHPRAILARDHAEAIVLDLM